MSFGLVCLNCRRYIRLKEHAHIEGDHFCKCEVKIPSWDAKNPAPNPTGHLWAE